MSTLATNNPAAQGRFRAIARVARPVSASHGDAFSALRLGGDAFGREGDPVLNLDHFRMSGSTFPAHAHAGFSAVTYMLPESAGTMRNRDSLGDVSLIPPGGLHWTAAGSGVVHEEVPDRPGEAVEGFQIFIRQPIAQEAMRPIIHHVDPDAVPGDGGVRVLAGRFGSLQASFTPPSPLVMLDITREAGATFGWSPEPGIATCALYLFAGRLDISGTAAVAPALILFTRGETPIAFAARERARALLIAAAPLDVPGVSNGPFVLSSHAALDEAVRRYRSGAMGRLQ